MHRTLSGGAGTEQSDMIPHFLLYFCSSQLYSITIANNRVVSLEAGCTRYSQGPPHGFEPNAMNLHSESVEHESALIKSIILCFLACSVFFSDSCGPPASSDSHANKKNNARTRIDIGKFDVISRLSGGSPRVSVPLFLFSGSRTVRF